MYCSQVSVFLCVREESMWASKALAKCSDVTGCKRKEAPAKKIKEKMGTIDLSGKPILSYVLLFFFYMTET